MSFILDALKKSEAERQQQGAAEFTGVPVGRDAPRAPRWLWILGALLAVNLLALLVVLLRPDAPPQTPVAVRSVATAAPSTASMTLTPQDSAEPTFAERVIAERVSQATRNAQPEAAQSPRQAVVEQPRSAVSTHTILTFDEVRARGTLQMTDLHLDIHVYSDQPVDRFVFINMEKHRENSRLAEGPTVTEITPDGVLLSYQGTTFLLPRD